MFTTSSTKKNRTLNRQHPFSPIENLEDRRLMAADAFEAQQQLEEIRSDVNVVVEELTVMVSQEADARLLQTIRQSEGPEVFQFADQLYQANPAAWQQIIDTSPIPELGIILGESPEQHMAVTDLVLLELVNLPDEQQIVDPLTSQLTDALFDLLGEECPSNTEVDAPLPPQYEQLRLELGDEAFAQWLESNRQQTGTMSGVLEQDVESFGNDSEAMEQFHAVEHVLEVWLLRFSGETVTPPLPTLPSDIDQDGTVGFNDFLELSRNFGKDVTSGTGGDSNGDGVVNFTDFLKLSGEFGQSIDFTLPSSIVAGQVAYQPSLIGPILFDVVAKANQDPVNVKASQTVVEDEVKPIAAEIKDLDEQIEGHKKALQTSSEQQREYFENQIKEKEARIKQLKQDAVNAQDKATRVAGDKEAATAVLKDKVESLKSEKQRLSEEGIRMQNDPKTSDEDYADLDRKLRENVRQTSEIEDLLD